MAHVALLIGDEHDRLARASASAGVSTNLALVSGFSALLHRYSGLDHTSLLLFSPDSGQSSPLSNGEGVQIHLDLGGDTRFVDLLRQFRGTTLSRVDPGDREIAVKEIAPSGLDGFLLRISRASRQRLRLEISAEGERPSRRDHALQHLLTLMRSATDDPNQPLSALPLITPEEGERIALTAIETTAPSASESCIHELFQEQAERTPKAVAIACGSRRISYAEVNARADMLAEALTRQGIQSGASVALISDRSWESVVGLLAILKAGGAYVPMDSSLPRDRLFIMLRESQCGLVVTNEHAVTRIPFGIPVVRLGDDAATLGLKPTATVRRARREDVAYMIFTSGSTGTPKAVLVSHQQIVGSTAARIQHYGMSPDCTYLMLAPLSFDASAAGIFGTLSTGGRLVIPTDRDVRDPRLLRQLIEEELVTHVDAVPSQYWSIIEGHPRSLRSLRCCILGGEVLPPQLATTHFREVPQAKLYNEYGPTEATVWSTVHECSIEDGMRPNVPIGRPIPNVRTYVLDSRLYPVPFGVPGELCIGGAGVTLGYANSPQLTADRFVPDPFARNDGERMYRTGDLARRREDGLLEYVGRRDDQVKLRGFRIEIGEIERVLRLQPEVLDAAVVVRSDLGPTPSLAAFVVAGDEVADVPATVRALLQDRLPRHMIPAFIFHVDSLPMSNQGKVDRTSLRSQPPPNKDPGPESLVEFENPDEQLVAGAFSSVLDVPRVRIEDDFFALGGDSLSVAALASQLSDETGVDLHVDGILEDPSVKGIAQAIGALQRRQTLTPRGPRLSDLASDASLDAAMTPVGLPLTNSRDPVAIFVTGATGYVGCFLLERLLSQTRADTYCLVRAESTEEAQARIKDCMAHYRVWDDAFESRIHAVVGSLEHVQFGLPRAQFERLANVTDAIYHCGALVNLTLPYSALRATNVLGTEEVIRLACVGRAKAVHYVSTMDVLTATPRPHLEASLPDDPSVVPRGGYAQSKWVAEKKLEVAKARGLPTCIFRLGRILSHSVTGATQVNDLFVMSLKAFLSAGAVPDFPGDFDAVSVDSTCQAIVQISRQSSSSGGIFHVKAPRHVTGNEIYAWLAGVGYVFSIVPRDAAEKQLDAVDPDHPLSRMAHAFRLEASAWGTEALEPGGRAQTHLESSRTATALRGSGVELLPMDEKLVRLMTHFLARSGYLPSPNSASRHAARDRPD